MANQIINVGTTANDGTGDKVRDAFIKVNSNFAELYDEGGANITVNNPVTSTETTLDEALSDLNTGGGGTPTLQEVTDEGNVTTNPIIFDDSLQVEIGSSAGFPYFKMLNIESGQATLFDNSDNTDSRYAKFQDKNGTLAYMDDITIPTLQEVTDEGFETTNIIKVVDAGESETNLEYRGINFNDLSDGGSTYLTFQNALIPNQEVIIKNESGTVALLSDIPTGGGIPHATASGTDTYTATITGVAAYTDADAYLIRFTNGNTTAATLNINSLGAKTLYRNNDGALIGGDIIDGGEMLCIYNTSLNGFQVIGTAPNSLFAYVTNDDSVTLTKGMPVYAFSGTGDRMTVKRANNSADATSAQTVGLVLSTSIAAGQKGLIMMQGLLDGLSILPTSTFADGDAVYLGATDGSITNVKPYAPNHLVYLGVVTTASNGSAGRMYVRIQNGYELSEIHDIDLITNAPTNNEVLTYESSTDLWKNKSIGTILGFKPYKFIQTSQTAHTGTVAETIIGTATINGGTFNSSDVMKVLFKTTKPSTIAVYNMRIRINTTNTLTGATQIGFLTVATANTYALITRTFDLQGGNLYGYNFASTLASDVLATNTVGNTTAYNTANTLYLFFTIQLGNIADSATPNLCNITN